MSSSLTDSRMSGDDESQSGSAAPPELPASIASVWEHPLIEKKTWTDEGGNAHKTWTCLAEGCRKTWNGHNSTKALAHGSKLATFCLKHNVRPCKGRPSAEEVKLFTDLCARKMAAKSKITGCGSAERAWVGRLQGTQVRQTLPYQQPPHLNVRMVTQEEDESEEDGDDESNSDSDNSDV